MLTQRAFLLHALSPLHPGTGQAVGLIDLPIARLRGTGIPFLPGSSIKGVLRDVRQPSEERPANGNELTGDWLKFLAVFGPDAQQDDPSDHAGALVVGDARLLLLPVRSLRRTFAYVTSPLLIRLWQQDLVACGFQKPPSVPVLSTPCSTIASQELLVNGKLFLEDLDLSSVPTPPVILQAWAEHLGGLLFGKDHAQLLGERLAIVDDDTMSFLCETAMQIDARVRIGENGVVAQGALWYEESLPAESVLGGLCAASPSRRKSVAMTSKDVLDLALPTEVGALQFGGKATVGRGRVRMMPVAMGGA